MTASALPLTFDVSLQQPLSQAIEAIQGSLPVSLSLADNVFSLDATSANSASTIELIVFSDIEFPVLAKILNQCLLTDATITAVNHRNALTSLRMLVNTPDLTRAREKLVEITLTEGIEAALVQNAPTLSTPGLLVMDMDSTTIQIECIDEIAALAGVGEKVAEVTELAMQGKLDFSESLYQRVGTLENAPESILAEVAKDIPLMPGLQVLIEELKQHNWKVAIASGGFTYFADHLKALLGLDAAEANVLEIVDAKLTGKVLGRVVDANVKAEVLQSLAEQYAIDSTQTVAMGDGANDLVMMAAAHMGVAYKAKPLVLAKADTSISHSGLDLMLHYLK
ncbi:phosphoserine phosphatase SerB [Thalassotalea euphylliae]|uniref:phosphoserine phosphatase SerB n=1 Tax=Thalassotalea euphylliae TaxID=1655234 RepID=UPI0036334ADB